MRVFLTSKGKLVDFGKKEVGNKESARLAESAFGK